MHHVQRTYADLSPVGSWSTEATRSFSEYTYIILYFPRKKRQGDKKNSKLNNVHVNVNANNNNNINNNKN